MLNGDNSKMRSALPQKQLAVKDVMAMDTIQRTFEENKNEVHGAEIEDISYNERVFYIREIQESKSDYTTKVKQYTITNETIRRAIAEQSKEDTSVVDKYLNIALRNIFGEFRNIELSDYDKQVNRVMKYWKYWHGESPRTRGTPLLYKCYKCSKGWWRLHPFREHLNQHTNVKLRTEQYKDELCVYACTRHESERKFVQVDSPCWRCGEDAAKHKIVDESVRYKCAVCKIQMPTCVKLKRHETTCLTYLRLEHKNDVERKQKIPCNICGIHYIEYKEYGEHLVDHHSVRSDEPIAIDANVCKLCGVRYIVRKFHDCPEKHKSFKCNSCSRKFTVVAMKNLHMQFSKGTIKCEICGKQMAACMAPEHYLNHTKSYASARICWGCENRVLFTKLRYHNAHMKHHISHVSKRRWGSRMLFPKKCLNGEIVGSEKIITIPNDELDAFMNGLEGFSKGQASDKRANSVNGAHLSKGSMNPENISNQDPKIRALQEQLDAEIMRDVQMEAAISEVFEASKSYRKLIEKEKMEKYIEKESMETQSVKKDLYVDKDEDSSDDSLVIIETKYETVTLNDSECEAFEDKLQREDLISDDEDSMSDDKEEEPESDETVDEGASDVDDDLKWIASSVAKEKDMLSDSVKNEPGSSQRDEEADSNKIAEEHNQFEIIARPKKEIEIDDKKNSTEETMENLDLYKCNKCHFSGEWYQYVVHGITWCDAAMFKCYACNKRFPRLSHYLCHLVEHGHEKFACPVCSHRARLTFTLNKHVTSHIRGTYAENYIKALSKPSRDKFIFSCLKCGDHVELRQFFEHWQEHVDSDLVKVAGKSDTDTDTARTEPGLSQMKDGEDKPEQEYSETEAIGDNEDVQLKADNAEQSENGNSMHACKNCEFEGDWKEYVMHCITRCAASDFGCDKCARQFPSLYQYLHHLVDHGYKRHTCPLCLQTYKYGGSLYRHVGIHVRNTFSKEHTNDTSESSQDNFVFACLRCGLHVELHQLFKHWSMHINKIDVPSGMKLAQKSDDFTDGTREVSQTVVGAKNKSGKSRESETDMEICQNCHFEGDLMHTSRYAAEVKCNICDRRFGRMQHYVNHLEDHGYKSLSRLMCDRHFQCPSTFLSHLTYHIIDNSKGCVKSEPKSSLFTCLQCGDRVNLMDRFDHWQQHFCINREKISYKRSEFEAKKIMRPDTVEKALRELRTRRRTRATKEMHCDVCHERFNLKNRYKAHLIEHLLAQAMTTKEYQRDKQLKCYFCPVVLSRPTRWKSHMREHSSLSVYKCDKCPRVFNYASTRFKHGEAHTHRIFICDACDTKFPLKRSLVNHFREERRHALTWKTAKLLRQIEKRNENG